MIETKCGNCKKEFLVKPFRKRNASKVYCSRECHHQGMKRRVEVKCATCGKVVERTPADIKKSKSHKYFCDKSCQTIWRNKYYSRENHINWKGGDYSYRTVLERSEAVKECNRCQRKDERILVVHHINEDHSDNRLENLSWLCHNCHHLVHNDEQEKKNFLGQR